MFIIAGCRLLAAAADDLLTLSNMADTGIHWSGIYLPIQSVAILMDLDE